MTNCLEQPYAAHVGTGQQMTFTDRLIRHCDRRIDARDLEQAVKLTVDWCGVAMAGVGEQPAKKLRASALASAGNGNCAAFGAGYLPPEAAAFVNGSLGTLLEMDDLHRASLMHAGNVVIPAALAAAQFSRASGRRFLEAIVIGYEAALLIGRAAAQGGYTAWYNSATCGVFGAALAAAHAACASESAKSDALGQAGMQASGLWQCRLEDTDSKSVATAHAARAGVTSGLLAMHGVRGARQILEGPLGFFSSYYPDFRSRGAFAMSGGNWLLHDVSFKPWPACRHVHPAVGLALRARDAIGASRIDSVHIKTYAAALEFCDNSTPRSDHEARFSLQHCVACALTRGALDVQDTAPEALSDPNIVQLRNRISVSEAFDLSARFPNGMGARIDIRDTSGEMHSFESGHAPGDPEMPLSDKTLTAKFHANLDKASISKPAADRLLTALRNLAVTDTLDELDMALDVCAQPPSDNPGKRRE